MVHFFDDRLVALCRVRDIISESCKAVTLETVRQKLRLSPPTKTLASTSENLAGLSRRRTEIG